MKYQKWFFVVLLLALMAGTAVALTWLKGHQRLGKPGISDIHSRKHDDED